MTTSASRPVHLACLVALAVLAGCREQPPSELVLVVDTNLSAVDVDEVVITVTGSQTQTVDVSLNDPNAPAFPLTLGLVQSAESGAVKVSARAMRQGSMVVQQDADTTFADGEQKTLRLVLLDDCVGISCDSSSEPLTCNAGACVTATVSGAALPAWTGAPPPRPGPSPLTPIGGRTLWANGWHSCANEGGTLYCWGQNTDGEIGDGSQLNASFRQPVTGISNPASIGLGQLTTCACDQSGQAWCWGRNVEGELGTGGPSATSTKPVKVPGLTDCRQIAGGANHTCALHADGTVSCWGSNASGQLGQPPANVPQTCAEGSGPGVPCLPSPARIAGLANVTAIGAGEQYTCALQADRTVVCWGDNSDGQLGDGTTTGRAAPAPVAGLGTDVVELAVGRFFSCVRHQDGTVSCWGGGGSGQLGNGASASSSKPVALAGIQDALQLGLGRDHACVLRDSGTVWCWGANNFGQLGTGTTVGSTSPVQVVGLSQIGTLAVGSVHSCARSTGGQVFCWGQNLANQLGDGSATNRTAPVNVAGFM